MLIKNQTPLSYDSSTSFFSKAGQLCLAFFIFSILFMHSAYAIDIDNLGYPENDWDGQVLNKLNTGPRYLSKNLKVDLPPPPVNCSQETLGELSQLKEYAREERTETQVEIIYIEAVHGNFSEIFLDEGPFDQALTYASYHILDFAGKEIIYFIVHYPGYAAYPYGHATQSMLFSKRLRLIDYAKDINKRCEIAGVKHHSDSRCGQLLANKPKDELLKVNEFTKPLEEARQRFI